MGMKRLALLFFFFVLFPGGRFITLAHDEGQLRFYYISKDSYTIQGPLVQSLREAYSDAVNKKQPTVFFLPNSGDEPTVVKINLPGDNRREFEGLISTLVTGNHQPNGASDIEAIIKLFDNDDYLLPSGKLRYGHFMLAFYVCPSFLEDSVFIPHLYFSLGLDELPQDSASVVIIRAKDDAGDQDNVLHIKDKWNICNTYRVTTY